MRVLYISIASLVVLFVVLLTARFWGLGQQHQTFDHAFFDGTVAPMIVIKAETESELQETLKAKSDATIWLDVSTSKDPKLIVFSKDLDSKEMSLEAYRGPKPRAYSLQQLKNMRPEVMELQDVLSRHPTQKFVLNILDNVEGVHTGIAEALKNLAPEKRILIQSNYNVIMTSLKELAPLWLYGCSQADLMRFLSFESMWLLPSTPFKGDVYIAPFLLLGRPAFHESTLEEVRRRNKKIILGPALNKTEFDTALRLKADAIIFEKVGDYLEWSRQ